MAERILAAMSGGVDSSVAAYLLQRQGYDVAGATMRLWDDGSENACCMLEDAISVANRLGIPHDVLGCYGEFDRMVVRPFQDSYLRGDTPNPCVRCNRYLKFGVLLEKARELGFDAVATGHYARICWTPSTRRWAVRKGREAGRDQSYFLSQLNQEQLSQARFPLGDIPKEAVRRIAMEQGFINARKRDSQDICFVPDGDYGAFLEWYSRTPMQEGDILDTDGRVLGRHRGAARYTLGQRKGLGVSSAERLYVCGKSMADNTVTLGPESALYSRVLYASDWVWGSVPGLDSPVRVTVKARSRHREQAATAEPLPDGRVRVMFDEPQRAVTVGQCVALYQGDAVLGGGIIEGTE